MARQQHPRIVRDAVSIILYYIILYYIILASCKGCGFDYVISYYAMLYYIIKTVAYVFAR